MRRGLGGAERGRGSRCSSGVRRRRRVLGAGELVLDRLDLEQAPVQDVLELLRGHGVRSSLVHVRGKL
eukprot:657805-Rhodomonas_salina.1